jgi:hypothetical protein
VKSIPPVPLRESMYLIFLLENDGTRPLLDKSFLDPQSGDLYVCLPEKILNRFEEFMAVCMARASHYLDNFYDAVTVHETVERKREELENTQRSLKTLANGIQELSFFNFYQHYKQTKRMEKMVTTHFSNLVDYNIACQKLRKSTEELETRLEDSEILRPFKKPLLDELRHDKIDTESLTTCANYLNDMTQRSYTNKISLLAVLLTIIGSVAGSVILDYLRSLLGA